MQKFKEPTVRDQSAIQVLLDQTSDLVVQAPKDQALEDLDWRELQKAGSSSTDHRSARG